MQTLLVAAGVVLILFGLLIAALVRSTRAGAVAKDDEREAEAAARLEAKAMLEAERERRKVDDL